MHIILIKIANSSGIIMEAAYMVPAKMMMMAARMTTGGNFVVWVPMILDQFTVFQIYNEEIDSFGVKAKAIMLGRGSSESYLQTIIKSIRDYLSIKTVTSLLTGILIWIGLIIIGVDYAIIWALLAFLLNYIPNFGSIIAGIPPVLFSFIQLGFSGVLWTTVVFVAVNMVIGNAVEPKMMGKGMGLSTFVVFLSLIFWGFVLGTVGMFLSVPLTMTFKIILEKNPNTKWIAIMLGTQQDAQDFLDKNQ